MFIKRLIAVVVVLSVIVTGGIVYNQQHSFLSDREDYETFLKSHKYYIEVRKGKEKGKKEAKKPDRPDLAYMQDFIRTMDPKTKRPMPELLREQNKITASLRDNKFGAFARRQSTSLADATVWEERGPASVGGRTRAMLFDPADPLGKKVWAGGITGGLWYNLDITDANSAWVKVDDFWDNMSVSCIAADPNNDNIMYVGTGESQLDARGGGIWKTTDGGASWTQLPNAADFFLVRDIAVRNESGTSVVYAAINPTYGQDNPPETSGLYRSSDGGTSWTQVLPLVSGVAPNVPTDIEIGADNSIWVGTRATTDVSAARSTIYRSTTGLQGSWEADASFTTANNTYFGQIELAAAPSDANVVYAVIEDGLVVGAMIKTSNKGVSWTNLPEWPEDVVDTSIPADDFTRGQAWYDLAIAVNPIDANEVLVGGIDLFKTTNAGSSWTQLSKWHPSFFAIQPYVHADQHEILYRPGFPGEAIFGNDGGVFYGSNLQAGTSSASINPRNKNYNVTQFYSGALHPTQTDYMLGGTQDNGTQQFKLAGFSESTEAYGGDGAMCFIDQLNPEVQIVSYVYNSYILSKDGGNSFEELLLDDMSTGNFINVADYDANLKILFSAKDESSIYRVKGVSTTPAIEELSVPSLGSMPSAMRLSPFATNQSNLYVGTHAGRLLKITGANSDSRVITDITGPFPNGSISGISFGASENQILVTFFNYGVVSIWETRDGGTTWVDREGNLPNMPVRWVEFHPHNFDQAYIATELGVWSTDNIDVAEPVWNASNTALANVRTDMLRIRKSDGIMMASTHGRGVFTALVPSQLAQEITFNDLPTKTYGQSSFSLVASSTSGLPVSFTSSDPTIASITGNNVTIHNAGTVTITASQSGNAYFTEAPTVGRALQINKASQAITFELDQEQDLAVGELTLTGTSNSNLSVVYLSSDESVAVIENDKLVLLSEGSTTITAVQEGNNNYLAASPVDKQLTIVARVISLNDLDFGEVIIGEQATADLVITNVGSGSIIVKEVNLPDGYTAGNAVKQGNTTLVPITFSPSRATVYSGEITVESNAGSGDNTATISGEGISITEAEERISNSITVFPNPADDAITITGEVLQGLKTIKVYDEQGRSFDEPVNASPGRIVMNITQLKGGTYILAIPSKAKTVVYKKIVKN